MILEAQIDSEEWDIHHLLADSDVALDTDMVKRPILKTWFRGFLSKKSTVFRPRMLSSFILP